MLAALAAALAINGYFAWQILGKPLQTEQTQTAAGTVPAEVQERLDAQAGRAAGREGGPRLFDGSLFKGSSDIKEN